MTKKEWKKELLNSWSRKAHKNRKIEKGIHCRYCGDIGYVEIRVNDKSNDDVEFKLVPCEVCQK